MTYVIDLERLWAGRGVSASSQSKAHSIYLDPRQNVVSAIVVADGDEMKLMQTLQSLLAQLFIREVIVIQCEENEELSRFLAKFTSLNPKCYIVNGQKNMGIAGAYNLGAQYASGQFLLFLAANCVLDKNAVLEMLSTGVRKPLPWIIGGEDGSCYSLKANMSWRNVFNAWLKNIASQPIPQLVEVSLPGGGFHVSHVAPACVLLPSKTFMELKGWDKKCFHSTFHYDLCMRIHLAGGGVYRAKDLNFAIQPVCNASISKTLLQHWQAASGWLHFYHKYVSKTTNSFAMGLLYGVVGLFSMASACKLCVHQLFTRFAKAKQTAPSSVSAGL